MNPHFCFSQILQDLQAATPLAHGQMPPFWKLRLLAVDVSCLEPHSVNSECDEGVHVITAVLFPKYVVARHGGNSGAEDW